MEDQLTILACVATSATVTMIAQATDKKSELTIKPVLGAFFTGSLLLLVSMWSSQVAKLFAVLLLITTLIVNAGGLFDTIGKVTS